MNSVATIIKKELTRVFTDKKLVFSLFIMPVILMIGIYSLIGKLQASMMDDIQEHISNVYVQNAPEGFVDFMGSVGYHGNVKYLELGEDVEGVKKDILDGKVDTLIVFEEGFLEKVESYSEGDKNPEVKTYYNPSEDYSSMARNQILEIVINPYQKYLLSNRIGNLDNIIVFQVDIDPESSIIMDEEKATGKALGMMLPYFITMMLFAGAMGLGVDAITGEKERGTLASMLITPLKRSEIVMGKIISLSILSCLSAAIYAISLIISMPMMFGSLSNGEAEGIALRFSVIQIVQLLVIMLTLVLLYVSIVSLVAVFAKTAKEASTYVSPIYIVVIVAGMITMFQKGEASLVYHAIPIYGSAVAIQKLLIGNLPVDIFIATIGSTLIVVVLLITIITSAFNSEKVMFNA